MVAVAGRIAPAQRFSVASLRAALRDTFWTTLVAVGLCIPVIAYQAEDNSTDRLVLRSRWSWVVIAVLIVAGSRLLVAFLADWRMRALAIAGGLTMIWGVIAWPSGLFATGYCFAAIVAGAAMIVGAFVFDPPLAERRAQAQLAPARAPSGIGLKLGRLAGVAGLAFLFVFPFGALALLGPQGSLKWIDTYGTQILIYVMLGWGLNIVVGLAGLLDLGYVAFYAVGAYSYSILSTKFGLSFWLCLPLAGILASFWGLILGFPVLRLRGDYLAIVTLAFGEIVHLVLLNWTDFSNGGAGISSIPRVNFFGLPFTDDANGFAAHFGIPFSPIERTIFLFYLILALALLTNFVTLRLRRLPVGRAWEALREDEIACRSLGINTTNTKLTAFALGAMFGGFAGSFFAVREGFVSPESFTFIESATILAIVVLGGMGSQLGVAFAAVAMIGGTEILRELDFLKRIFGDSFDPTQYRMLIFGLGMVVMMIWKPGGLVSTRRPSIFSKKAKSASPSLVKEGHG